MTNSSAAVLIGSMDTSPATFFFFFHNDTKQNSPDFSSILEKGGIKVEETVVEKC